jgi:HAD superfamily hydrolase (TIGR01549 family)
MLGIGSPTSLLSDFPGERTEFVMLRNWAPRYRERCWTDALRLFVEDRFVRDLGAELDTAFRAQLATHCPPYDDAIPMLQELARSFTLALLTNGPDDVQRTKLRTSGLDRFFGVTVVSGEVGFAKPDARIFKSALDLLGIRVDEAIAIGDSLERDVLGAHNAGLRCIWLNREGGAHPGDVVPDREIASLSEIPEVVAALSARNL